MLSALKYMSGSKTKVIHYDLKPGNILFDANGKVKITDFGLSKEMDAAGDSKMALTSQGAGTYWYLPPECFQTNNGKAPLISQKVDVWSVGVILYQMVYGKKPFGEDMSQETILRENVILNITDIEFPAKPAVSAECKDFIVCCLQKDVERRWSVGELCEHPFITSQKLSLCVCFTLVPHSCSTHIFNSHLQTPIFNKQRNDECPATGPPSPPPSSPLRSRSAGAASSSPSGPPARSAGSPSPSGCSARCG